MNIKNLNYTYDDKMSRQLVKFLYATEFGEKLYDHPDEYMKLPRGNPHISRKGQYEIDLVQEKSNEFYYTEVERAESFYQIWDENRPGTIVVSKYEKYAQNPFNTLAYTKIYNNKFTGDILLIPLGPDFSSHVEDCIIIKKPNGVRLYEFDRKAVKMKLYHVDMDAFEKWQAAREPENTRPAAANTPVSAQAQVPPQTAMNIPVQPERYVTYDGVQFKYFESAIYEYDSVITKKHYPPGVPLYWSSYRRAGFHPDEYAAVCGK